MANLPPRPDFDSARIPEDKLQPQTMSVRPDRREERDSRRGGRDSYGRSSPHIRDSYRPDGDAYIASDSYRSRETRGSGYDRRDHDRRPTEASRRDKYDERDRYRERIRPRSRERDWRDLDRGPARRADRYEREEPRTWKTAEEYERDSRQTHDVDRAPPRRGEEKYHDRERDSRNTTRRDFRDSYSRRDYSDYRQESSRRSASPAHSYHSRKYRRNTSRSRSRARSPSRAVSPPPTKRQKLGEHSFSPKNDLQHDDSHARKGLESPQHQERVHKSPRSPLTDRKLIPRRGAQDVEDHPDRKTDAPIPDLPSNIKSRPPTPVKSGQGEGASRSPEAVQILRSTERSKEESQRGGNADVIMRGPSPSPPRHSQNSHSRTPFRRPPSRSPPRGPRHYSNNKAPGYSSRSNTTDTVSPLSLHTPTGPSFAQKSDWRHQESTHGAAKTLVSPGTQSHPDNALNKPTIQAPTFPDIPVYNPNIENPRLIKVQRLEEHRAKLKAEHVIISKNTRRALHELELSTIELRTVENRRKLADAQLEEAVAKSKAH